MNYDSPIHVILKTFFVYIVYNHTTYKIPL